MKVFILEYCVEYEGGGVVAVFKNKSEAEKHKTEIETESKRYDDEMERTDFESNMPCPEHYGDNLYINEYEVK